METEQGAMGMKNRQRALLTKRRRRGAAIGVALALGAGGLIGAGSAAAKPDPKVTLCHATGSETNPYELITVAAAAAYNGHLGPDHQDGRDIIPPFTYQGESYSQNWPKEQAIWHNGCAPVPEGGLGIYKSGPAWVLPGGFISYKIAITNFGEEPVSVKAVDVKDPSANVVRPTEPDTIKAGETVFWTATSKRRVRARSCWRDIKNTASVSLMEDGGRPNTSSWTTSVVCPRLAIKKTASNGPVAPGATATYDITVTNTGRHAVPFEVVDENLVDEGATITPPEDQTPIEPGEENARVWTASVPVPLLPDTKCGGQVSNTASISLLTRPTLLKRSTGVGESPLTSTAYTDVVCPVDITAVKTSTSTTVVPGGTVPYNITVTNPSAAAIPFSSISVADPGAAITRPN